MRVVWGAPRLLLDGGGPAARGGGEQAGAVGCPAWQQREAAPGLTPAHPILAETNPSRSSPQVVEHLESELGVQVQRVAIHKMKYSFQIWSAMMSSTDSNGQVGQTELAKAQIQWQREKFAVWGQMWRDVGFPDLPGALSAPFVPPSPPFISFQSCAAPSPLLSHEVTMWLPAEEQCGLGRERLCHVDLFCAGWYVSRAGSVLPCSHLRARSPEVVGWD